MKVFNFWLQFVFIYFFSPFPSFLTSFTSLLTSFTSLLTIFTSLLTISVFPHNFSLSSQFPTISSQLFSTFTRIPSVRLPPKMGVCQSKLSLQVVIIGLDESGKSTILNHLTNLPTSSKSSTPKPVSYSSSLRSPSNSVAPDYHPTTSFQQKKIVHNRSTFKLFDLSGSAKTRDFWKHFITGHVSAIIFVVDATNRARLGEARTELSKILMLPNFKPETPLLILANKCDLPTHMSYSELADGLGVGALKGQEWSLRLVSGIRGEGFDGALDWLVQNVSS